MKNHACFLLALSLVAFVTIGAQNPAKSEDAYRANNIGVALLEQYKYKEAANSFRRALAIDSDLAIARVNLAIALYHIPDIEGAAVEIRSAVKALPDSPHANYLLGLTARLQNRTEEAISAFQKVLSIDSQDVGSNINLAQLYIQQRNYTDAIKFLRAAVAAEPYNATATYALGLALQRTGQRDEGQRMIERFQKLRESGYSTSLGHNYPEEGRYAEALATTGTEPALVSASLPQASFTDATSRVIEARAQPVQSPFGRRFKAGDLTEAAKRDLARSLGGDVALFDADGDGDSDLIEISALGQKFYRNDGGKFIDLTSDWGLANAPADSVGLRVVAGDYDNDGKTDLFVCRYGASSLYHNDGGRFSESVSAGIPNISFLSTATAFLDIDHDGDLDIFIAGLVDPARAASDALFPDDFAAAPNLLLRNNGDGKFTNITSEAGVAHSARGIAVIPTDYDNRREVDLLIVNHAEAPVLLSNLRDGTFRNVAAEVGLTAKARFISAAAGDFNKDTFTDFFFGRANEPGLFATSDGRGRFNLTAAPAGTETASAAQMIDYDNDGLLDLVIFTNDGLKIFRNLGNRWSDASQRAGLSSRSFVSGDVDDDGDVDIIARLSSGEIKAFSNEGGNRNSSLKVRLAGRASNRSGVGSKIETRAGSLSQKLEYCSASPAPAPSEIILGLGPRAADVVRVTWPSGNLQSEIDLKTARGSRTILIREVDRKPSSCPYLYAWSGGRFEFITDFLGGGEMGYLVEPGSYNTPDPDEYVRIRDDQLRARDGRYEIRITNELEEVLFLDRTQLVAVAHPADTEVFPNEGLIAPPRPPHSLYAAKEPRLPVSAIDDHGCDVLDRIAKIDRSYPDDFQLHDIRGYAETHTLTLDVGKTNGRTLLLLTGWTDYAFSSDNLAAHQRGLRMMPPALEVRDPDGQWKRIIEDIGIPVGRPQTIVVDLTDRFLSASHEVRILTNMRIYWDRILVCDSAERDRVEIQRLDAVRADLRWRGFSAPVSPDGREPYSYDYDRVTSVSPWKTVPGRYTREGDVRELLTKTDDMYVISRPGDEIAVSFDATRLPRLRRGWKRTFLLYADGFSKELDINSATPYEIGPLPYHAMKRYPYAAPEKYPMTAARLRYFERYNTRVVRSTLPPIESELAAKERAK